MPQQKKSGQKTGQKKKPAQKTSTQGQKKKPAQKGKKLAVLAASTQEPAALMKKPAQEEVMAHRAVAPQGGRATRTYDRKSQYVGPRGGVWALAGWREQWELTTPPPSGPMQWTTPPPSGPMQKPSD